MQLRASSTIYRETFDQLRDVRAADAAVFDYQRSTEVIIKNVGKEPFERQFDGKKYHIPPGQQIRVPLQVAIFFLGDWSYSGRRRRAEHERLKRVYRAFDSVDQRDVQAFNESLQAYNQVQNSNLSKADKAAVRSLIRPIPVPQPIPQLEVLDPDTLQPFNVSWPLYEPDFEFKEPEELEPVVGQRLAEIQAELDQLRRAQAEAQILDVVEAQEDD